MVLIWLIAAAFTCLAFVFVRQCYLGVQDHKRNQHQCPLCGEPWDHQVTQQSATVANLYITYQVCPNWHKMAVPSGRAEPLSERLGGWLP